MNEPQAQAKLPGTEPTAIEPSVQPQAGLPANGEGVQPVVQPGNEPQAEPSVDPNVQNLQRMLNERTVQSYQLQQRLEQLETQMQQAVRQPTVNQNPYDPNLNPNEWWDWKIQQGARLAAQEANQALLGQLQQMAMLNSEQQWQANHQDVNIADVKAFARSRWGTANFTQQVLDDARELMTKDYQINQVRNGAMNQAINQFRNTNSSATPMRSNQAPPVQPQLRYTDLLKQWVESDGRVEAQWSPEVRDAFQRETNYRKANPQVG